MKPTRELEHEIREAGSPSSLSAEQFSLPPLPEYLRSLLVERGATVGDVVVRCGLDRSYAYQLFNGTRRPTRNFLLLLSLALGLEEPEAQRLLKIAGRPPLYARDRRDAGVLYALSHGLSPEETDSLLRGMEQEGLF